MEAKNDFIGKMHFALGSTESGADDKGLEKSHQVFVKSKVVLCV